MGCLCRSVSQECVTLANQNLIGNEQFGMPIRWRDLQVRRDERACIPVSLCEYSEASSEEEDDTSDHGEPRGVSYEFLVPSI